MPSSSSLLRHELKRIADALERNTPQAQAPVDLRGRTAYLWRPHHGGFRPPRLYRPLALHLLKGIEQQKQTLLANTHAFAQGHNANNALLWGAKGMGKSSLVKAVVHQLNHTTKADKLVLIDVQQNDMPLLTVLLDILAEAHQRFIIFCDDIAFETHNAHDYQAYHALKATLEGSISEKPDNVIIYATSNRRHLTNRSPSQGDNTIQLHEKDTRNDTIALSDRFGLWLGFHACDSTQWYAILDAYLTEAGQIAHRKECYHHADIWAQARGERSGRVAAQFMLDFLPKIARYKDPSTT